jgi:cysteine sulfinate desulfinase/cysteine desulfurase-like protein
VVHASSGRRPHIITSPTEHAAVAATLDYLAETQGLEVTSRRIVGDASILTTCAAHCETTRRWCA